MKLFLPSSHIRINHAMSISGGVFLFPLCAMLFRNPSFMDIIWILVTIGVILFLCFFLLWRLHGMGLYITNNSFFHKSFLNTQQLSSDKICAIKISKALGLHRFGSYYELKDSSNELLYTMFLLSSTSENMQAHESGDLCFMDEYKKHIICRCVYDQSVIDYLLTLNPNIIVF